MTDSKKTTKTKPAQKRQQAVDAKGKGFQIGLGNEAAKYFTPPENGIGERIRLKRAEIADGLTVEDLSRVCKEFDPEGQGVSRAALFRYESGKILPGARELRILCEALAVSPNWLLLGTDRERWTETTSVMVTALDAWVRERANRGELDDMLSGYGKENDAVRHERIQRALAKEPKP